MSGTILTNVIAIEETNQIVTQFIDQLSQQATIIVEQFALSNPTPERMLDLGNTLHEYFRTVRTQGGRVARFAARAS